MSPNIYFQATISSFHLQPFPACASIPPAYNTKLINQDRNLHSQVSTDNFTATKQINMSSIFLSFLVKGIKGTPIFGCGQRSVIIIGDEPVLYVKSCLFGLVISFFNYPINPVPSVPKGGGGIIFQNPPV